MSWLQTYTLRLRKHERSTTTGRVVFVIQLQLGQQDNSQARDVGKRSYSEFRALWKDLVRTTSASVSDGVPLRGRNSIRSTRLSIRRESWSSVSRLLTGAFGSGAAAGGSSRGSEIDRSSRNKKHCRCTQTSCPFQRLYHLLKDYPFPRKQLLQHKDLEQRRVALEEFLIQLQRFFCGYPRSFLETAASTQRCEVLKLISHFAGMDTRLASLSAINEAFTTDLRPERKRYFSYCVSPIASPSPSLTRLTDTTDNTEETLVSDERLSDNQAEHVGSPHLQVIVQSSTRSSSTEPPVSPSVVLPQLQIKSANVKTYTTNLDEVKDALVRAMGSEVQAAIERDQLSVEEQWEFALFHAAEQGQYSDVVTILRRGTNVNGKVWSEATPLHAASGAGHVHVVQCLLSHGAAVDQKGPMGMTPLMCAANNAQLEATKLLLRAGADVNQCNTRNVSVVHLAVASDSLPLLLLLLDHGARVDIANSVNGRTPLHIAAEAGNKEICEILLKYGARVSHCNASGRNACEVAVEHSRWSVQKLCSQHRGGGGITTTLLEEAEEDDDFKFTFECGDDDEHDDRPYSPLRGYIDACSNDELADDDVAIVAAEGTVYAVL